MTNAEYTAMFYNMMNSINELKFKLVNENANWYDPEINCYVGRRQVTALMKNISPMYADRSAAGCDYILCGGAKFYKVVADDHFQMMESSS